MNTKKLSCQKIKVQVNLIRGLKEQGLLPKNIDNILYVIRKARNEAVHTGSGSLENAKTLLKLVYNLANWFMEVYGDWNYSSKTYVEPQDVSKELNYEQIVQEQEKRIKELTDEIEEIHTAAIEKNAEDRNKRSKEVSEHLDLSNEEEQYLAADTIRLDITAVPVIKEDLFGKLFRSSNDRNVDLTLETIFDCQKWRDYALAKAEPLVQSVIDEHFSNVREYIKTKKDAYQKHLEFLLKEKTEKKESVSSQLSEDERRLQIDNDWLTTFEDRLKVIERG